MRITLFNAEGLTIISPPDLKEFLTTHEEVVWIDVEDPTPPTMALLKDIYNFHPLAVEDTCNQQQRPKVEEYHDHLFMIMNSVDASKEDIEFREVDIFLGRNYLVTAHVGNHELFEQVHKRMSREGIFKHRSSDYLLYVIFDIVVDGYFPLLDRIEDEIEAINERIFTKADQMLLSRLFEIKRTLNEAARISGQHLDIGSSINRREQDLINHDVLKYYLRDVHDHLLRLHDLTHTLRDNLSNTIDLYLSSNANRLNIVVNRLAVITIVTGVLSVFVGFYGMNFLKTWPPFEVEWGVPFVMALMGSTVLLILYIFKRQGWY